jgi:CubicO group peptidase (beta-lactamase class C family)
VISRTIIAYGGVNPAARERPDLQPRLSARAAQLRTLSCAPREFCHNIRSSGVKEASNERSGGTIVLRLGLTLILLFTLIGSLTPVSSRLAFGQVAQNASLTERVDKLFGQWNKPDSPGCALGIIKDGKLVYARGYGMANLAYNIPIQPNSVFLIASISKQFTAMAILMLVSQNKLSLDDDVRKYVPELPALSAPLTIRQLLHHTSGIRDEEAMLPLADFREHDVITEADILKLMARQKGLNYEPGEDFLYSNTGYTLLAVVVKRVSGQSLREFAAVNIFKPLGMSDTQFVDDHTAILKNWVAGYEPAKDGHWKLSFPLFDFVGPTNVYTTIKDLARWDQNFYDKRVGGQALLEQMLKPGVLKDGKEIDYAAGLFVGHWNGLRIVEHDGGDPGYRADFIRFPDQHFSVACFCNVTNIDPTEITRQIAGVYLADEFKKYEVNQRLTPDNAAQVPEKDLVSLIGIYFNPITEVVRRIAFKNGKLMYVRGPDNESALKPLGNNRFLMVDVPSIRISFEPTRQGEPSKMYVVEAPDPNQTTSHTLSNTGRPNIFKAVKAGSYSPKDLAAFAGSYFSQELDVTYTIRLESDKLIIGRKKSDEAEVLTPKFVDMFNATIASQFSSVRFKRSPQRNVTGFTLTVRTARKIGFRKL